VAEAPPVDEALAVCCGAWSSTSSSSFAASFPPPQAMASTSEPANSVERNFFMVSESDIIESFS